MMKHITAVLGSFDLRINMMGKQQLRAGALGAQQAAAGAAAAGGAGPYGGPAERGGTLYITQQHDAAANLGAVTRDGEVSEEIVVVKVRGWWWLGYWYAAACRAIACLLLARWFAYLMV